MIVINFDNIITQYRIIIHETEFKKRGTIHKFASKQSFNLLYK
jgi:hypothetical protein